MKFPEQIFSQAIDQAFGLAVLHSIWQITLIALIAGILLWVLRARSAALRYMVLNGALLLSICVVVATFFYCLDYQKPLFQEAKSGWAAQEVAALQQAPAPTTIAKVSPQAVAYRQTTSPAQWSDYFYAYQPLIVLIWLLGLLAGLFRLMGHLSYSRSLRTRMNFEVDPYWSELLEQLSRKAGFQKPLALLESALVRSPLTIGWLKPAILFPIGVINKLSEQEVEAILAHELAHIVRHDYLFNLLQSFTETIFYYHPAVWWLSAQVRNEREHACDDLAIQWLGDKRLVYAKSLVAMQEMAYFPQTQSLLAFAGNNRGQLLQRVQRLFSPQTFKLNIMEKWIATLLVACSVAVLAVAQRANTPEPKPLNNPVNPPGPDLYSGIWQADFFKDSVCLNLSSGHRDQRWMMGECYPQSTFGSWADAEGNVNLSISRPAGTLQFSGKIEGAEGFGKFKFVPDDSYIARLEKEGIQPIDQHLMIQLFWANFSQNYVAELKKSGFREVDADKLVQLAVFKVDNSEADKLKKMASGLSDATITIDDLIQLKVANVQPEMLEAYRERGLTDLDLSQVVAFSMLEVDPGYMKSMQELGLGAFDAEAMTAAKVNGVTPEYVRNMQATGIKGLDLETVMSLKIHGVEPKDVKALEAAGFDISDVETLLSAQIHGIDPAFISEVETWGFRKPTMEDLVSIKIHGINAQMIQDLRDAGIQKLDISDLVNAQIHDISPEYIRKMAEKGYRFDRIDDYVDLKIQQMSRRPR